MLKQGFQEDIEKIFKAVVKQAPRKPQTLLFSATIPSWVKQISQNYQNPKHTKIDLIGQEQVSVPKTIKHMLYIVGSFHDIPQVV